MSIICLFELEWSIQSNVMGVVISDSTHCNSLQVLNLVISAVFRCLGKVGGTLLVE